MNRETFNPGPGVGSPYTPIGRAIGGAIKIPVCLTKEHPDYEGPHEPFWVHSRKLASLSNVKIRHCFTGTYSLA